MNISTQSCFSKPYKIAVTTQVSELLNALDNMTQLAGGEPLLVKGAFASEVREELQETIKQNPDCILCDGTTLPEVLEVVEKSRVKPKIIYIQNAAESSPRSVDICLRLNFVGADLVSAVERAMAKQTTLPPL